MNELSPRALRELTGVHPALVAVVKLAWTYLHSDYEVIDGIRTHAEQRNYVRRGVSKTMNSYHLPWKGNGLGHAADIVPMVNGVPKWPNDYGAWKDIEQAMKRAARELGVTLQWGGDWKNRWDKPHWQITRGHPWKGDIPKTPKPPANIDNSDAFKVSLKYVLKHEGGYVNDPHDPGGATNRGITIHTLKRWRKRAVTPSDVKSLTLRETARIYEAYYWDTLRLDDVPKGVDYPMFSCGVLAGVGTSAKIMQRIVGAEDDGRVGKNTMTALNTYLEKEGRAAFIKQFCADWLAYLKGRKGWPRYGRGWGRRVREVREVALVMAKADKKPDINRPLVKEPKAPGTNLWGTLKSFWRNW